jgi:hypothetical protein
LAIPPGVFWEEISESSTKPKKAPKQSKKKDMSGKGSGAPMESDADISGDEGEPHEVMVITVPWMQVYIAYILRKEIPEDPVEARQVIRRLNLLQWLKASYTSEVYRECYRGASHPKKEGSS